MNKVDQVLLRLDGKRIYPCYEYGATVNCTQKLTGKVFYNQFEDVYMDACTAHVNTLSTDYWEEINE